MLYLSGFELYSPWVPLMNTGRGEFFVSFAHFFIFLCLKLVISHYHSQKKKKRKRKMNHAKPQQIDNRIYSDIRQGI